MARTPQRGGGRSGNGSAATADDTARIVGAALAQIAGTGWLQLSLASVAATADLPLVFVYRRIRSKPAILIRFVERIDEAVLAEPPQREADEHPRDRLFDLLMRRFDALRPYKTALAVLRRELPRDPRAAMVSAAALCRSMRWMLDAADIRSDGIRGLIATEFTLAAYLATMRVWQGDDAPDLARTMAGLDARLRRIEGWLIPTAAASRALEPRSA